MNFPNRSWITALVLPDDIRLPLCCGRPGDRRDAGGGHPDCLRARVMGARPRSSQALCADTSGCSADYDKPVTLANHELEPETCGCLPGDGSDGGLRGNGGGTG